MTTITLSGDAQGVEVGAIGLGLMNFSWRPTPVPDEQAFAALDTALAHGSNFWNAGTFYSGSQDEMWNLQLLQRYFAKYPEKADQVVLSVKGGNSPWYSLGGLSSSLDTLRAELQLATKFLGGTKKIDIFEPCRRDQSLTPEEIATNLKTLQQEGYFKYIGLSEVSAATIRAFAAVAPIAAVEMELSPFSLDVLEHGVVQTCNELGIAIVAYSPLSRGLLGGQITSIKDIPAGDVRHHLPRYQPGTFELNLKLADAIHAIAEREGISTPALVYAWIRRQGPRVLVLPGCTRAETAIANAKAASITISDEVYNELNTKIQGLAKKVHGPRYPEAAMASVLA